MAILVIALIASHVVGYWSYRVGFDTITAAARDRDLAERVVSIKRVIGSIPVYGERERTAHALSSTRLNVHWGQVNLAKESKPLTDRAQTTAKYLRTLAPDLASESFRIAYADDGALSSGDTESFRHLLLISVKLSDGSWVNFSSPTLGTVQHLDWGTIILAIIAGFVTIAVSILLLHRATRPLMELAAAAERFSLDERPDVLDESGPVEIRRAARAFNTMRERIQKLVAERTQSLAAVSHDLRTPITRIRLRSEFVENDDMRRLIDADLDEMDSMIGSTLEYLRHGVSSERARPIDIVSVLDTLCHEQADQGRNTKLFGLAHYVINGRMVSLKRAFTNIINNALAYSKCVNVEVSELGDTVLINVRDCGPGIPDEDLERVFEPFYRADVSRSRSTGGAGLGLAIARNIIRAHEGKITLSNRKEGGLEVAILIPRSMAATR